MELKKNVSQKPLRNFFVLFPHFWLSGMDMTPVANGMWCWQSPYLPTSLNNGRAYQHGLLNDHKKETCTAHMFTCQTLPCVQDTNSYCFKSFYMWVVYYSSHHYPNKYTHLHVSLIQGESFLSSQRFWLFRYFSILHLNFAMSEKVKFFFYLWCIMGNNKECRIRAWLEFYWWPWAK